MNKRLPWLLCTALTLACTGDDAGTSDSTDSGGSSGTGPTTTNMDDGGSSGDGDGMTDATDDGMMDATDDGMMDATDDGMMDDTGDSGDSGDSGSGSTGGGSATVSGEIDRSAMPGVGNDAIGDIYLGLLPTCAQGQDSVASTVVMDADLSDPTSSVAYEITDVPAGTYYLAGFMDDNDNADPTDPGPDMGDLAAAMGLGPACTEVTVAGEDVSGINLTLNLVVPF